MPTSLLRAGPLAADFVSGANRPTFAIRNGHRVAEFPSSGTTETFYTFNMPTVFAQGDISVKLQCMAKVAIVNDVVWAVAFERHQNNVDDLDSDSFAADIVAAAATVPGTSGQTLEVVIPVTAAQYDGIVQGEQFRLRVRRLGDDGADTLADIAQLMTVVIEQDAAPAGGGGGGFWADGAGTRAGIGKGSPVPTAIGLESLAHGSNATAGGASSIGFFGTAEGADGVLIGRGAYILSTSLDGIALGRGANIRATCPDAIAIGRNADVRDTTIGGIALGYASSARGDHSIAIGYNATSGSNTNANCVAIGYEARAGDPSGIAIGNNVLNYDPNAITIGSDIYLNVNARGIAIGYDLNIANSFFDSHFIGTRMEALNGGDHTIAIGNRMVMGFGNEILIGNFIGRPGISDRSNSGGNLVMTTGDTYYQGAANPGGAYQGSNLVLCSGSQQGGLKPYPAITQYRNICIGTGRSYIYGQSHNNLVMGYGIDMGDYQNAAHEVFNNVHIGNFGRTSNFTGAGNNECYKNTVIGYSCYVWNNVKRAVAIGSGCGQYYKGTNYYYTANVSIGLYSFNYGGMGNVAMGAYCEISDATYTNQTWSRGNFAIGYGCEIKKIGTGGFRSTMAQGCGADIAVNGQRAFSDDVMTQHQTTPNQGSFIIPKIETIDATQTTILTFPTFTDKAYALWGWIVARRTDVDGFNAAFSLSNTLVHRNLAGAPLLIGNPKAWVMDAQVGAPGWLIDISIVANDIVVRVTGTAAQTIEWLGWIQVIEVRG